MTNLKKILAMVLVLAMVLTMLPVFAAAAVVSFAAADVSAAEDSASAVCSVTAAVSSTVSVICCFPLQPLTAAASRSAPSTGNAGRIMSLNDLIFLILYSEYIFLKRSGIRRSGIIHIYGNQYSISDHIQKHYNSRLRVSIPKPAGWS